MRRGLTDSLRELCFESKLDHEFSEKNEGGKMKGKMKGEKSREAQSLSASREDQKVLSLPQRASLAA
jgi:hypothetical protein